jgi:outer membrane cobalamin receptor
MACHHLRGRGMALASDPGRGFPGKTNQVKCVLAALALLCLAVSAARAEDAAAPAGLAGSFSPLVADTLVVRASALADPVTPAAGGLVTRIDLEEEQGGRDLAQELAQVAGLQVRRYGGAGFAAVPALRGASAAQIRVFLDGMPLNSAQTGDVDLSRLPVERFAAAEVHRGAVPSGWGGLGGAGAINLVTRAEAAGTEVGLFTGAFGDVGGRATWGAGSDDGRRSVLLLAHGRRADNDYRYTDHNQTFHNTDDDTTHTRQNAWFEEYGFWGSARQETDRIRAKLAVGMFRKDGGRPGPLNYPSPSATVRYEQANAQALLGYGENLTLELSGARDSQFLYDPANEIDDGFGGTISSRSEDVTARLSWTGPVWRPDGGGPVSAVDLVAGLEQRRQWYRQWYGDRQDPRRHRRTGSAFAAATIGLARDRVRLLPAWRWQRNEDDFPPLPALPWLPEEGGARHRQDDVSPSLGAVWEIQPETVYLQGHAARSVRVPTWIELFGHRGGIDGNRELLPEEITSADVAVTWKAASGGPFGRVTVFLAETRQTIVFVQNSPGTSKALNIGQTRTRGVELEGLAHLPGGLRLAANLTVQKAEDRGEDPAYAGNSLPFLSDVVAWMRLGGRRGPWHPWVEVTWESERYRDRANTELDRAPDRTLVNLGLARDLNLNPAADRATRMTVAAEVINLLDDQTYDVEQFPLPGRSWQLSARLSL